MILTACTTLNNKKHETQNGQKIYKCGIYMCLNIKLCADKTCQKFKLLVDTGSAGVRVYKNELSEDMKKKLNENAKKYGNLKTIQGFYNFDFFGFYTTANVIFENKVFMNQGIQVYEKIYVQTKNSHIEKEKNNKITELCKCQGIFGISNTDPVNENVIINIEKAIETPGRINCTKDKSDCVAYIISPFYKKNYEIKIKKYEGNIKIINKTIKSKQKNYNTIIDTGSPCTFSINNDIGKKHYDKTNVIGLNNLYNKTIKFYETGTIIGNTLYVPYPKQFISKPWPLKGEKHE